jgi:hypothetical protein
MRNILVLLLLLGVISPCYGYQGCLNVVAEVNGVFCPKCSDSGASARVAGKKISADLCLSCSFYCWYTATPEGGEYSFVGIADDAEPGCRPSEQDAEKLVKTAIPLALGIDAADFGRLVDASPVAAATLALMLWRDAPETMSNAHLFEAQFRRQPSRADAIGLYRDFERNIDLPSAFELPKGQSIHVRAEGVRVGVTRVRLTLRSFLDEHETRRPLHEPLVVDIHLEQGEVATEIAGRPLIASRARAYFPSH